MSRIWATSENIRADVVTLTINSVEEKHGNSQKERKDTHEKKIEYKQHGLGESIGIHRFAYALDVER